MTLKVCMQNLSCTICAHTIIEGEQAVLARPKLPSLFRRWARYLRRVSCLGYRSLSLAADKSDGGSAYSLLRAEEDLALLLAVILLESGRLGLMSGFRVSFSPSAI